ncbi:MULTISPECIES: nucleotidyltransferase domain-containing protein [unclassified Mucilaginibacter]|uniref:nucleotidyltransferase domain-containing protein n=1 Tax=unclassified Mucilaginibacter TaxID=2617802 RepID=UPI002AC95770|nr:MULTISPECIES: nucleotidyltransferase domain-containing protein [unclassified Mucilaginibacter]MEB0260394.1 nucleotidyltransferase domain-containing protein [Mucilaginibacter sp. 10I4]MEB0279433.1 nucleotidyltransferase domain-containing protein [Mucilaginibacter sp. 10B2]MEB0299993.1 nucleotidyltransferase domain-containing protein [Mucilaginibacter sp. 5C4]WPX21807.1 nucleotidyltransferase domain-containing protein [Mucilaginibacter sp. 5C4]
MHRRAEILQWLKNILDKNLSNITYRAFIVGSQANKEILSRSDIDVGIIADVNLSTEKIVRIHEAIQQLPMHFKVDVVDFYDVDGTFKTMALSNIEVL